MCETHILVHMENKNHTILCVFIFGLAFLASKTLVWDKTHSSSVLVGSSPTFESGYAQLVVFLHNVSLLAICPAQPIEMVVCPVTPSAQRACINDCICPPIH